MALVFGNEKDGISEEAMPYLDGNFIIPQHGMTQSLNISVACAVTLFEALRQRDKIGAYDQVFDSNNPSHAAMIEHYSETHFNYIPDRSE